MILFPYEVANHRISFPFICILLIIFNSVVYFFTTIDGNQVKIFNEYGLVPNDLSIITFFTSMFLHGDFMHLLGNMFILWMYGDNVEDIVGPMKFIVIYLLLGLISAFVYFCFNYKSNIPCIGASGAISGLLGIYWVLFPDVRIEVYFGRHYSKTFNAKVGLMFWLGEQLFFTVIAQAFGSFGVAFMAHSAGFIGGIAIGYYIKNNKNIYAKYHNKIKEMLKRRNGVRCPSCSFFYRKVKNGICNCKKCESRFQIKGYETILLSPKK